MPAHDSDSEDDPDYVPPADSSDDERNAKRARTSPPPPPQADEAEQQRTRAALWSEFRASVAQPSPSAPPEPKRTVKIEKRFRFAGEEVVEVKEVPEDSEDAKKWPRWQPPAEDDVPQAGPSTAYTQTASSSSQTLLPPTSAKPPAKRPGPRRPKTTLAPLPGEQKAKKLTTLDKSAMDWRSHVQIEDKSGLKDELEANRRGGGYLEKVEFLQRVEDRKASALDTSKAKRRRP
ncbi:bucentaur or craniofacial development-domain-containing protein [Amylocystis lapponica]|nr:bucentaur or craniofacial development-domain-containing protein [Amylocystis lapponica]